MIKIIRVNKRNLVLLCLALLGVTFLVLGQWILGNPGIENKKESVPTAKLVEKDNMEKNQAPSQDPASEEISTNVLNLPGQSDLMQDAGAHYFVDYRLERQRARGQRLELLREIINNPESEKEVRIEAQEAIMAISSNMSKELELESLIRAKGFTDAIVFLEDDCANVVVKADNLTPEEATRICDLVARGTGISEQNVIIIPTR